MATERGTFSIGGLVVRNVRHYWRTNVAVVLGCAIAVAALVGSLLVGGSVRGSLRDVALERLGPVQYALSAPWYFRQQLATDIGAQPAILLSGTVKPAAGRRHRAERLRHRRDRRLLGGPEGHAALRAHHPHQRHARPRPRRETGRRRAADRRPAGHRAHRLHLRPPQQRRDDARAAARGGRRHPRARRRRLQPAAGPPGAAQPLRLPRLAADADRPEGQGEHGARHQRPGRGAGRRR